MSEALQSKVVLSGGRYEYTFLQFNILSYLERIDVGYRSNLLYLIKMLAPRLTIMTMILIIGGSPELHPLVKDHIVPKIVPK